MSNINKDLQIAIDFFDDMRKFLSWEGQRYVEKVKNTVIGAVNALPPVGAEAVLNVDLDATGGWKPYNHILVKGSVGKIVDYSFFDNGKIYCLYQPKEQTCQINGRLVEIKDPVNFYVPLEKVDVNK